LLILLNFILFCLVLSIFDFTNLLDFFIHHNFN